MYKSRESIKIKLFKERSIFWNFSKAILFLISLLISFNNSKDNLDNQCLKNVGKDAYIKSNVKYDDFKSKMLEYVTEEYFNHNFSGYINVDGNVGYKYIAMGIIPISVNKVELFGYNDNEYIFTVTFRDDEMYDHFIQKLDDTKEEDCYFKRKISLTYENDKLLVSEYLNN